MSRDFSQEGSNDTPSPTRLRDRKFLQGLKQEAEEYAKIPGQNQGWTRMYENLADAVDHLDAALARTNVFPVQGDKFTSEGLSFVDGA
jgi:hypothetical protein